MFDNLNNIFKQPEKKPVEKQNMGGSKWTDDDVRIIEQIFLQHKNGNPLSEDMQKIVDGNKKIKETWEEYQKRVEEIKQNEK